MVKLFLPTSLLALLIACTDVERDDIVIDVKVIVNKDPVQVEEILGKPDSSYTLQMMGRAILCQLYKDKAVEIQYPELRASDIVVHESRGLPFDQTALSAFNLDYRKQHPSDYRKGSLIRWTDFEGFSAISFYNARKDSRHNITNFSIFFKAKNQRGSL